MPNRPSTPSHQGSWSNYSTAIKAWIPKRNNYMNRNAYLNEIAIRLLKLKVSNNGQFSFLEGLPMGNRLWLYEYNRSKNTVNNARKKLRSNASSSVYPLLKPTKTNLLMWSKNRGGKTYAHRNYARMKEAIKNYPRLVATAKKLGNPNFLTRAMVSHIEGTPSNDPAFIHTNLPEFRRTVRGNAANAAKKLLEIREKAAKRTIARYVKAGHVGVHISQVRKLRAMNRARGIGVSPKKRASSAPPVLNRRR